MRVTFFSMLLTMTALFTLALGMWLATWLSLEARRAYGQEWGMLVFFATVLVIAGAAAALYRWQDELMGMLGIAGYAPPEVLYCQTCGTAASPDAMACVACGGTRFALSIPGTAAKTRWHVQVGMDVYGSDERPVGVVKRRRVRDFLVARALQRDLYVPFSAITGANAREVHLSVPSDSIGHSGWARPALIGRPR